MGFLKELCLPITLLQYLFSSILEGIKRVQDFSVAKDEWTTWEFTMRPHLERATTSYEPPGENWIKNFLFLRIFFSVVLSSFLIMEMGSNVATPHLLQAESSDDVDVHPKTRITYTEHFQVYDKRIMRQQQNMLIIIFLGLFKIL